MKPTQPARWTVRFHEEFDKEFAGLPDAVQDELLAQGKVLEQFGPTLGRPHVDTLKPTFRRSGPTFPPHPGGTTGTRHGFLIPTITKGCKTG